MVYYFHTIFEGIYQNITYLILNSKLFIIVGISFDNVKQSIAV